MGHPFRVGVGERVGYEDTSLELVWVKEWVTKTLLFELL
jgi:hypothetical protein